MPALLQLTLRSLHDGIDPQGLDAALLATAPLMLDEALAALPAANQVGGPTTALDVPNRLASG